MSCYYKLWFLNFFLQWMQQPLFKIKPQICFYEDKKSIKHNEQDVCLSLYVCAWSLFFLGFMAFYAKLKYLYETCNRGTIKLYITLPVSIFPWTLTYVFSFPYQKSENTWELEMNLQKLFNIIALFYYI